MKEKTYWAIFQVVIANIAEWQLSTRKLTEAEINRISNIGDFSFDFKPLGLDFFVSHHVITGCYIVGGSKEAAKQIEKQLNEKGTFFYRFADDEEEGSGE